MDKPNWRIPEDYAYTDGLHFAEWIWEFLRRNPEYREDYRKYAHKAKALKEVYGKDWRKEKEALIYDPPKNTGETDMQWIQRVTSTSNKEPNLEILDSYYGKKWHLKRMYNPEKQKQPVEFLPVHKFPYAIDILDDLKPFIDIEPVYFGMENDTIQTGSVEAFYPQYAVVVYDLVHDLPEQITKTEQYLKKVREQREKYDQINLKGERPKIDQAVWESCRRFPCFLIYRSSCCMGFLNGFLD